MTIAIPLQHANEGFNLKGCFQLDIKEHATNCIIYSLDLKT